MLELLTIPAKALCFILSKSSHELNQIEGAIRLALEKGNSPEELEAMRLKACMTESLQKYYVSSSGKARRF